MKLTSQCYVRLGCRNVPPGFDRIPWAVGQSILTGKVNIGKNSRKGLLAISYIAPQKQYHDDQCRYNPYNGKGYFFPRLLLLFVDLHSFAPLTVLLIIT